MKAMQLIDTLTELVVENGDIPVKVYDGMDPADLDNVKRVELVHDGNSFVIQILT